MESFHTLCTDLKEVVFQKKCPRKTVLSFTVKLMKPIGLYADGEKRTVREWIYSGLYCFLMFTNWLTITFDLYESSLNFVDFGDTVCIIIGISLIFFKALCFRCRSKPIANIVNRIMLMNVNADPNIQNMDQMKRTTYLQDNFTMFGSFIIGFGLCLAIAIQPFFYEYRTLPLRAEYLFLSWETSKVQYLVLYFIQVMGILIMVESIVAMDQTSGVILNQIALQFKILAEKFSSLYHPGGSYQLRDLIIEHKNLICFTEEIGAVFQPMIVAQVVASMMIICLTAFEATLTLDQMSKFFKFAAYMFASFIQLLYWCWIGDSIYDLSQNIERAAMKSNWISMNKKQRKDLLFVIQRAQKPVTFRAGSLYIMNYDSFISILSGSYTYFTMLRSVHVDGSDNFHQ